MLFYDLIIFVSGTMFLALLFLNLLFCLQHTSLSPDGKLLVIVGDKPEGLLVDAYTGKVSNITWLF